jgi:branched-subunit amino acid transport protein
VTGDLSLLGAVAILAAGTLALRLTGPVLRVRIELTPRTEELIATAVAVLFCAVVATSALIEGQQWAGLARPAGVLVAAVLAWRRAPLVFVVLAAAATTAGLRLLGVP